MDSFTLPFLSESHYSLLDGLSRPSQIAARCKELGYTSCALTDHGTISGGVSFYKECRKVDVKPILGIEAYISYLPATIKDENNRKLDHILLLAKNLVGYKEIIQLNNRGIEEDLFYYKPRFDMDILSKYCNNGNVICITGHIGSNLANEMCVGRLPDNGLADNAEEKALDYCKKLTDIFGKENFFIEIQLIDVSNNSLCQDIADVLRPVCKKLDLTPIATADSHYPTRESAKDQHVLLCSSLQLTLPKVNKCDFAMKGLFTSNNFHIPTIEDLQKCGNTDQEIENTCIVADMVEEFDITSKPKLPKFSDGDQLEELKELCRQGWREKLVTFDVVKTKEQQDIYVNRLQEEFKIIKEADLAGYFLIVSDYVRWAKKRMFVGPGRGSVAGCLVAYLSDITEIDPIPHNLLMSRFYNAGRNTKDNISMPDIDVDFPKYKRDDVFRYIESKYGSDHVAHICTFGRLMGRGALKEVLRIHEACSFAQMNDITKQIPDEARIADQMENLGEDSVLMFVLKHDPELVKDYCTLTSEGEFEGEYAQYFEQAVRLEGTNKSQGTHAAGVVISDEPLADNYPLIRDKTGKTVLGLSMKAAEDCGLVKLDVLGLTILDKLMYVNEI